MNCSVRRQVELFRFLPACPDSRPGIELRQGSESYCCLVSLSLRDSRRSLLNNPVLFVVIILTAVLLLFIVRLRVGIVNSDW